MLGAVIAVLGWTGKQVLEWFFRLRAEQKSRRSRLLALLAIRRAAEAIWASQCKTRDKFVALVRSREEAFRGPTKTLRPPVFGGLPINVPTRSRAARDCAVDNDTCHPTSQPSNFAVAHL